MQTVICMKWGTLYGPEYVNRLHAMVRRNTRRPLRFICFTEDAKGLHPGIEVQPLPPIRIPAHHQRFPWRKMSLWGESLGDLTGQVLFLDLDLVVTGDVDGFFDHAPGEDFVVIRNWTSRPPAAGERAIGNTSCFRLRVGSNAHLLATVEADFDGTFAAHRIEQVFLSRHAHSIAFWPEGWCVSFKHSLLPPWPARLWRPAALAPGTRLVAFTGKPDVHDVLAGRWPAPWYKKFYKSLRRPDWVAQHWRE